MILFAFKHFSAFFSPTTHISQIKSSAFIADSGKRKIQHGGFMAYGRRRLPYDALTEMREKSLGRERLPRIRNLFPSHSSTAIHSFIYYLFHSFFLFFFPLLQSLKQKKRLKNAMQLKEKILKCIYYCLQSTPPPYQLQPPCTSPCTKENPFFAGSSFSLPIHVPTAPREDKSCLGGH